MTFLSFRGGSGYISALAGTGSGGRFDLLKPHQRSTGWDFKVLISVEPSPMGVRNRDWVPRVHPETGVQRVGGKWVAATPDDALHYFEDEAGAVSEVASRIIALIDGRRTVGQIVDTLCEEFEVQPEECEREVERFVELLVEKQVLSP